MPVALEWLIWAFATSFAVCAGLIVTQKWHGRLTLDHDTAGIQKLHERPVPRIGGVGVFCGLLAAVAAGWLLDGPHVQTIALLLLCALPTFAAGLLEDLTKRVTARQRLGASFASAALAAWLLDGTLNRLDIPGLDSLMAYSWLAAAFTAFAVSGVTNAINIIDGLNGLASGSVTIMLTGLGVVAWLHGDELVLQMCLTGAAAALGFMLLNYPFGRIFLGDGGAYLAGFWLAECSVLLLVRNPSVSTWAPLLICFYPVWETCFSMYRRRIVRGTGSGRPDMVHLHHLLFRRRPLQDLHDWRPAWFQHGVTSALLWMSVLLCQVAAVILGEQSLWLAAAAGAFAIAYCFVYGAMSRASPGRERGAPAPVADGRLFSKRV